MPRILLAAHPTAGHTNALRAIGGELKARGHDVAMAITETKVPLPGLWPEAVRVAADLPDAIAKDGVEVLPLAPPPSAIWYATRLPRAQGYDELGIAVRLFTAGLTVQSKQVAAHATAWRADVVVGDYLMPSALLGARSAGRRYAALYHSALPFPMEGGAPFGSGLAHDAPRDATWRHAEHQLANLAKVFDERVGAAARELHLSDARRGLLLNPISEDLNLLATTADLEPGLGPLTGPVVMTGPCLPRTSPGDLSDPALKVLRSDLRRVYVSLGTVFNAQPRVFETILDGLNSESLQVVVSAGASFDRLASRNGPRTHVFRRVPQVALLPRVSVVVTHGGNNTVQETLAAGRPMIVVPFGGDQLVNARRVERLGVGVAVLPGRLSASEIRRALELVSVPGVVERAQALGAKLRGRDGVGTAADAILKLVSA